MALTGKEQFYISAGGNKATASAQEIVEDAAARGALPAPTPQTRGATRLGGCVETVSSALPESPVAPGGTGTTAGAFDTQAHRDEAIVAINDLLSVVGEMQAAFNLLITELRANGVIQS